MVISILHVHISKLGALKKVGDPVEGHLLEAVGIAAGHN